MNPSRKTSSVLLAAGLGLTALTAFAQSSNSTSASQDYAPVPPPEKTGAPLSGVSGTPRADETTKAGEPGAPREFTVEQFMAVDTDFDGRISLNEFVDAPILSAKAGATARSGASGTARADETTRLDAEVKGRNTAELFHRLDKNENGYLSSTEMAAYYQVDSKL